MNPPAAPDAPAGFADWTPVPGGRSGALVLRSPGSLACAKVGRGPHADAVRAEHDRLRWLGERGVAVPRVLDLVEGAEPVLVTSALAGVAASSVPPRLVPAATSAVREALATLHALPTSQCPYDRSLAVTLPLARARAAAGLVDTGDLDPERAGWGVEDLLARLDQGAAAARAAEPGDLVVCHGDATGDNVLVDPDRGTLVGIIDVGALGVADRHLDLALASRAGATALDLAAHPWTRDADPERVDFYRLLDEFF